MVELSVIIPTLNEEPLMGLLFATLSRQKGVVFEVILSDGNSSDATCRAAEGHASRYGIPLTCVKGAKGRGKQLNAGAAAGIGNFLLFLHADSRFEDLYALRKGVDRIMGRGGDAAAKFALRFERRSPSPALAYFYYESKARLLRAGCTHGDQGLIMHRDTYGKYGPFDEFPPMLAETRLAERIRTGGELRLIPTEILTSARRFEAEGLYDRQALNAILMNCAHQGWFEPFRGVAELYRNQGDPESLPLYRALYIINKMIKGMTIRDRRQFWRSTGEYVRQNAWQIAFLMDVRRNFKYGLPPGAGSNLFLEYYDRRLTRIFDCSFCNHTATVFTWCWFNFARICSRRNS